MKRIVRLAVISAALAAAFGAASAQNTAAPKGEDAEKNAFQTPTTGKKATDPSENSKGGSSANPESRLNDDPRPQEKVGAPK